MADLKIVLGKNSTGDNTNVPWYMEIIQNSIVILQCFSTQADPNSANPTQCGITANFDPTIPTVINYYNLGKLTNNIAFSGVNLVNGVVIASGGNVTDGRMGSVSIAALSGSFSGSISVICNELSTTASGVNYVATGTQVAGAYPSISSVKPADGAWVSTITPNTLSNPWYVAGTGFAGPVVATTGTVGVNLVISNVQAGDSVKVSRSNTVGVVDTLSVTGTTVNYAPPSPGTYKFRTFRDLSQSAFSNDVVVVSASNQLGDLAITTIGQIFINDSRLIEGLATGATFAVQLNDLATVLGTDYQILANGEFKFLKFGVYKIWQTKPDFIDSVKLAVNVADGIKPNLPIPLLSSIVALVNGTVTVENYTSYDNVEVKKGLALAVVGSDYTKVLGVITFLTIGSYRIFGYKLNHNNSQDSDIITITAVPLPSGNARGRFHYNTEESLDLFASGDIDKPDSTGAGYRWLNNDANNIMIETVIKYVDKLNPAGLSGIMAFDQGAPGIVPSSSKMAGVFLKNDNSIGVLVRGANGLQPVNVKNVGSKSFPIKLRLEKVGTDFVFSYSTNVGVLSDTLVEIYRTPIGMSDYVLALAGSSGTGGLQTTQFEQTVCSWGIIGNTGSTN